VPAVSDGGIGRGQSRWFRGEACFTEDEAGIPLWDRLELEFGVPAQDEKLTDRYDARNGFQRQTNYT
jgi:hypothetical protein